MKTKDKPKKSKRTITHVDVGSAAAPAAVMQLPNMWAPRQYGSGNEKPNKDVPKKLRKFVKKRNKEVMNQPISFEPELAKLTQQVIENEIPNIVWDPPSIGPTVRSFLTEAETVNSADYPEPANPVYDKLITKFASAAVEGLEDAARVKIEDVLLAALPGMIDKFGPQIVRNAIQQIDTQIVDFCIAKQLLLQQQEIETKLQRKEKLEKWLTTQTSTRA